MPSYTRPRNRRRYAPRRAPEQEIRAWAAERPENEQARAYLEAENLAGRLNSFTHDIHRKLHQYGNLSERQVAAVLRGAERDREFAARREAEREALQGVAPLRDGRRLIVGEVISAKWKVTPYGMQAKMLVREHDGNKVWGTIPAALVPADDQLQPLVGQEIALTATVRRSDDDEHFGFYSRPQAAVAITEPEPSVELPAALPYSDPMLARCDAGHAYDVRDGFCESCAEARMELQGAEFGEDL